MTAVRYYLDDHVSRAVENGLQMRGIDALRSFSAGMSGASDAEHLTFATSQGRTVYTNDEDFTRLHTQMEHAGIVYARVGIRVRDVLDGLELIFQVYSAEEMQNRLEYL